MNPKLYWIERQLPGKLAVSARPRGGDWLEDEIEGWRRAGVDAVVSLLTGQEAEEMKLEREASLARTHGIHFISLPIEDRSVPNSLSEASAVVASVKELLKQGRNVAVHCRQGIGRSGMIAVAVLVANEVRPEAALSLVSEARGLPVPETDQQREWVLEFDGQVPSNSLLRAPAK